MERLDELIANADVDHESELYVHLANVDLTDEELAIFGCDLLPKLFKRIDDGVLRKEIVYLGLLSNANTSLLSEFIEYELKQPLDSNNGLSLFAHCYYRKHNWFTTVISNDVHLQSFDANLQTLFRTLRVVELTNSPTIQLDDVQRCLAVIDTNLLNDDFLQFYLNETKYILYIINYCETCLPPTSRIDKTQLFACINHDKLLVVFDTYLALDNEERWMEMLEMLRMEERRYDVNCESDSIANDVHEFQCYNILAYMIKALRRTLSADNDFIARASTILTQINPKLRIHVLEDIFTLCFLKWSQLEAHNDKTNTFVCDNDDLQMLLHFVAFYVDSLKAQIPIRSVEAARLQDLEKHVKDAQWRLKILDDLPHFDVTHMLSDAETLIQISLDAGCFDKAHQVIQVKTKCNHQYSMRISVLIANSVHRMRILRVLFVIQIAYGLIPPEYAIDLSVTDTFIISDMFDSDDADDLSALDMEMMKPATDAKLENKFFLLHKLADRIQRDVKTSSLRTIFQRKAPEYIYDVAEEPAFAEFVDNDKNRIIFNVHDTELAKDVIYTEKLNKLRTDLLQSFTLQELSKQLEKLGQSTIEKTPQKILNEFFGKNNDSATHLDDVIDIAFTLHTHPENTKQLLTIANNHTPTAFHSRIHDLFTHLSNISMTDIILSPQYNVPLETYVERTKFRRELENCVNSFNNTLNKTYSELKQLLNNGECNYFHRLLNYLKIFRRAFTVEDNNLDLIPRGNFDILQLPRSRWMGKLLLERGGDPRDYEHLFSKLKLDLLCCTATCCFPDIRIRDNASSNNFHQTPSQDVFTYIAKRNWLLAFLINEIFHLEHTNATRTKFFTQYVDTPEITHLMRLYDGNRVVAALNRNQREKCLDYINRNVFEDNFYEDLVETAEEVSEDDAKCDWKQLLALIESIPENQGGAEVDAMRDNILSNLIEDAFESDTYKYVNFVKDNSRRRQLILDNFSHWPGDFCVALLRAETDPDLLKWAERIQFCDAIRSFFEISSWFEMYTLCLEDPCSVSKRLLEIPKASLILDFETHFGGAHLPEVSLDYVASLLRANEDWQQMTKILNEMKNPRALCMDLVNVVRDLTQLDFLVNYMSANKFAHEYFIKNVRIASVILQQFPSQELEHLWPLIKTPLAIIEMLIMNMKLDRLSCVLDAIRAQLENCEFSDHVISLEAIDDLLRQYAEKSLEFRVILEPHPSLLKGSDGKLMQSLDSVYGPDRKYFQMPAKVPSRAEWIPNNEILECMCCQNTIFSMFNRRHHCRRCGRIICFNCSMKRMQVPSYGDILVRVCLDCYDQSQVDNRSDTMSTKSVIYDQWFLSDRNEHNAIVRQEFSYEHAPSVSLCLSIMKYHTKTYLYPKFLLDQCDTMLTLLQPPTHNAPQEVDHMLVITMLRSLAIAAKMLSSDCQLSWGTSQADRILSQADLFALLAERGCLNLLPPSSTGAPYVDAIILRKLRDKLLMQEQWAFALDISTKAGMDNAGVFAAWGKSCLKAGCLHLAREKFRRCFEKSTHVEDDFIDVSSDKPLKDPPILEQIIEILESQTVTLTRNSEKDSAMLIKAKLRNLKAIANGNLEQRVEFTGCNLDSLYFHECLYYLKRYGSHLALLQFHLRHNCVKECLMHIFEHKVHADIFIEVYMNCLRDGKIDKLLKAMSRFDSTLEIWKEYLKAICRHLEKQGLLNSLYQLQQFMVDFVRAAMTCIRFYKDNSTSYKELSSKIHFLHKAEAHLLEELEQQQWVEVNAVVNNSDSGYEEKIALSNPSLVMKMDAQTIDQHIRTIRRQNQLASFLAEHEKSEVQFMQILPFITPNIEGEHSFGACKQLPTLFDSHNEKVQLAVLLIICGDKIQDGYDLAHSLIEDYKLKALRVYCQAGRQLAREDRYNEIAELVSCIRSKGSNDAAVINVCDEMLMLAVRTLSRNDAVSTTQLEVLIKLITDRATKISIYIETKQLKSAYLLAAKYNRFGDIRRILREAELLNKHDIKKLCQKLLHVHSHSKD